MAQLQQPMYNQIITTEETSCHGKQNQESNNNGHYLPQLTFTDISEGLIIYTAFYQTL